MLRTRICEEMLAARKADRVGEYYRAIGQTAGLIDELAPAGRLVGEIAGQAERIIRDRLAGLAAPAAVSARGGA